MAESSGGGSLLKKGCLLGCGCVTVIGLAAVGGGAAYIVPMFGKFDNAVEKRKALVEKYGEQDEFTPALDGAVPADRLDTYLEVRRGLRPFCDRFDDTMGRIERISEREHDDDPSLREVLGVTRAAFGLAPLLGDYFDARNKALLDAGMGLGEYTYIHIVAAYAGRPPESGGLPELRDLNRRVRRAVIAMLRAQRDALAAAEAEDAEPSPARTALEAELVLLDKDRRRRPYQDGLPPPIVASLAGHEDAIEELRCPIATQFELARNRRRGISIQAD